MAGGNGVQFTGVYAQMLFEMFLENLTSSGDSNIKTFHFVPEDVTPNIYRHTLNAFLNGKPSILHYDADLKRRAQRRKEATAKYPTIKGMQRDEYPYASTFEGGVQPDGSVAMMAYVPEAENRSQGGSLSVLYRAAGLKTGDAFMVIPVPKGSSPEEVKQEVFERLNPHPLPVGPSHPSIGNPVIPYKQWPLMMGAAVVVGLIMYARFMPVY
ncbi:NucA/NucB deoxyribonuclease domain-containing protein [Chryseobacterium gossypii]|uniref:NucA/NucB deoxyribonuclease domain-containing protein n=1 Tax=Chryseobacterium gossypii TaxID=3231602 RepID=UPI003524D84E